MAKDLISFLLNEDDNCLVEHELDEQLNEWLMDSKTRGQIDKTYEYKDRTKFGLTFSHVINRITTANLSKHTFENTRNALKKTVADCDTPHDISFLRRDMSAGKILMRRIIEKHPDPKERAEAKTHLKWLESEYANMLSARLKEIKAKQK